ncbi:hypothetical protein DWY46_17250 [Blautia obeum]|uniref:Uncharacterized protein n=1 Tax=Blautia obeum TaxID=40520 RepID=A0A412ELI5_9FIRM|nr:hypothetical protein [Blautia obeum]RGI89541.1 hypothetical protein DXD81_16610 [Blautia obeum]RGR45360.1 hypothetical protein DWY46_17250 [Blautia obeum]RGZ05941.1 hypothetical protein DXA08_14160 [Blautia obeum]
MENLFTHFDLTEFPQIDRKEEIIETQKKVKKILKDSRNQAKKKRVIIVENHVMDFVILILFLHFV